MKANVNFTGGERMAALILLTLILSSYLVYYLYDGKKDTPIDARKYLAMFNAFETEQARLADSAAESRQHRFDREPYPYSLNDTSKGKKIPKKPLYDIVKINLNRCDSTDITVVPQFGSKRAARLVEYRDRLGGFYSLSQLKEVYVLQTVDDELIAKYFVVHPSDVRKLNINEASYKELISHPYFDAYLTKTILNYRQKNGKIHSLDELQKITHAYPELMEKLKHYVVF